MIGMMQYVGTRVGTTRFDSHSAGRFFFMDVLNARVVVHIDTYNDLRTRYPNTFTVIPLSHWRKEVALSTSIIHLRSTNSYWIDMLMGMGYETIGQVLGARTAVEEAITKERFAAIHYEIYGVGPDVEFWTEKEGSWHL